MFSPAQKAPGAFPKYIKALNVKKILVCCLLVVVGCSLFAQQSKQEKLEQLKTREDIKVTEVEKDILKLEYRNGKVLYKNIGEYKPPTNNSLQKANYSPTYDSTIIDLTTIDTTLYYEKYKYWQEAPISNSAFSHILVGDVNKNGKPELYGVRKLYNTDYEPVTVYELNNAGKLQFVYQYDSVMSSENIFDIDKDGKEEIQLGMGGIWGVTPSQRFFSKPNDNSLATTLDFAFIPQGEYYQMNDVQLGDYDNDGKTDLLCAAGAGRGRMHIYEYNSVAQTFDSVYSYEIIQNGMKEVSGFSTGDFDLDGKTDIVFGTGKGAVHVIENQGENQYSHIWEGMIESYHAYIHTWTHDIDRNGKPEFWVLGDAFFDGVSKTRITLFEASSDNNYEVVGRIDLIGVFSFYAGTMQAVDIDKDGIDEVAICIDGNFLLLKFNGSKNHQIYKLHYIKQGNYSSPDYDDYHGAIMSDLLNNGRYEILLSMQHIKYNANPSYVQGQFATTIYKPDTTTSISESNDQVQYSFSLQQNYPSPFNPTTTVSFTLSQAITITIKVYNILGKEITTLVDENLSAGEHSVQWDGKDQKGNLLPGGIYFIQMIAGSYQKTIKTILLK